MLASILFFGACCKKNGMAEHPIGCTTVGTVKDLDGLDGCGYLIELPNGDLLNPASYPGGFVFKDKKKIRFDYKILPDAVSICMAENATVEITCISEIDAQSAPQDCAKITNPFTVPWMDKAIDRHNAVQVIKQQIGGKWVFLFRAVPTSFLYDCDGNLLCETKGDNTDDCHRQYLNRISKGKVIWQSEGVWD